LDFSFFCNRPGSALAAWIKCLVSARSSCLLHLCRNLVNVLLWQRIPRYKAIATLNYCCLFRVVTKMAISFV